MSNKITTLIVDDEPYLSRQHIIKLTNFGLRCAFAVNELDAMYQIRDGFYPETAMIDAGIPEGGYNSNLDKFSYGLTGGFRLSHYILNKINRHCRIVILTGIESYRVYAQEVGVWGFCSKPVYDYDALLDMFRAGSLSNKEIGQPTLDINYELKKQNWGKERK